MTDEEKAEKYLIEVVRPQRIEPTVLNCNREIKKAYLAGLKAGREETEKQWHDCFLSCSSPYCAGHFPAVKMEGDLGNMSKREVE